MSHETETGFSRGRDLAFRCKVSDGTVSDTFVQFNMAEVDVKRTLLAHTLARQACCGKEPTRNVPQVFLKVQSYYKLH